MRTVSILYCVMFIICFPVAAVHGDYLEVRRSARINAEPSRDASLIEQVASGVYLQLLDNGNQTDGYYHVVAFSQKRNGWIYRTLVRRHAGEKPGTAPQGQVVDTGGDTTSGLNPTQQQYALRHLRLGKPQAIYERVREGYVLAQDARLKIPLWIQYELSPNELAGSTDRTEDFKPDTSIPFGYRAELEDYENSGFDRGHLAPAADMKRSETVMSESFLLSNIAPQTGIGFNRNIWSDLESAVRGWVEQRGALTIITGPVFAVNDGRVNYKVIGGNCVAVPTHFYKIIVDAKDLNHVETLAFMLPNENLPGRKYSEFLTTIDEIEKATGLDFLSTLPVAVQDSIESRKASKVW